ncbi:hypothetical protein [Parendozoicomonas sp. Alg238-R29]|uniref:hypothetical protein n=1 Tax=Parendozoicomonas sp. Alg238-R29 TaxID=2993446 RepID=UPI00248E390F|nr:hypothetical protein [Parendozoicomonas sp. Alg238-R29]
MSWQSGSSQYASTGNNTGNYQGSYQGNYQGNYQTNTPISYNRQQPGTGSQMGYDSGNRVVTQTSAQTYMQEPPFYRQAGYSQAGSYQSPARPGRDQFGNPSFVDQYGVMGYRDSRQVGYFYHPDDNSIYTFDQNGKRVSYDPVPQQNPQQWQQPAPRSARSIPPRLSSDIPTTQPVVLQKTTSNPVQYKHKAMLKVFEDFTKALDLSDLSPKFISQHVYDFNEKAEIFAERTNRARVEYFLSKYILPDLAPEGSQDDTRYERLKAACDESPKCDFLMERLRAAEHQFREEQSRAQVSAQPTTVHQPKSVQPRRSPLQMPYQPPSNNQPQSYNQSSSYNQSQPHTKTQTYKKPVQPAAPVASDPLQPLLNQLVTQEDWDTYVVGMMVPQAAMFADYIEVSPLNRRALFTKGKEWAQQNGKPEESVEAGLRYLGQYVIKDRKDEGSPLTWKALLKSVGELEQDLDNTQTYTSDLRQLLEKKLHKEEEERALQKAIQLEQREQQWAPPQPRVSSGPVSSHRPPVTPMLHNIPPVVPTTPQSSVQHTLQPSVAVMGAQGGGEIDPLSQPVRLEDWNSSMAPLMLNAQRFLMSAFDIPQDALKIIQEQSAQAQPHDQDCRNQDAVCRMGAWAVNHFPGLTWNDVLEKMAPVHNDYAIALRKALSLDLNKNNSSISEAALCKTQQGVQLSAQHVGSTADQEKTAESSGKSLDSKSGGGKDEPACSVCWELFSKIDLKKIGVPVCCHPICMSCADKLAIKTLENGQRGRECPTCRQALKFQTIFW